MRKIGGKVVLVALILVLLLGGCVPPPEGASPPEGTTLPLDIEPGVSTETPVTTTPAPTETPAMETPPETQTPRVKPPPPSTVISDDFDQTFGSHFGFMPAFVDFSAGHDAGGAYDRPHFELFQWGRIERLPGRFDFTETDHYIFGAQGYGYHILANIQPFAQWDQDVCHSDLPSAENWGGRFTKGKPCDMEAYREFVVKMVERYDGDGVDDMPGLTMPIKHWEVMNEPEFNSGDLIFFQGSAADYFEILKVTYEAVKEADPEALVVQGGMAGMAPIDREFWQAVFDLGGADYFDIANMHSIGHGEHLNLPDFEKFLARNGIDKPVWVTEVQFQQAGHTWDFTNQEFASVLARSYTFALAHGVDKLFYVNLRMPQGFHDGIPFDERSSLVRDDGTNSALFDAHLTIRQMLGDLTDGDSVEILSERVGEWQIDEGKYRFNIGERTIYVLWGGGALPAELTGQVRVTQINGESAVQDAGTIKLSLTPVFVEPLG